MDVIGLSEAVSVLTSRGGGKAAGRHPVVVTFDDGTADFVDTALPLLVRYRIPATLYVATRFVEERKLFPHDEAPLSWGAIRDAISTGLVTVGSHTHSHLLLDHAGPAEAETDLRRSTQLIGERLDVSAEHFAYPRARLPRSHIETIVRQLFGSAAVGGNRANVPGNTDAHRLARSPIQASDGMRWFGAKLSGGLALEERLRGTFRGA
jgi:peptidoglycan/xylan/chitin deacetylase (PgdA/CDA1 family)